MRYILPALLAIGSVLAHEGEEIEQHSAAEITMDSLGSWLSQNGHILFGVLAGIVLIIFLIWLVKQRDA